MGIINTFDRCLDSPFLFRDADAPARVAGLLEQADDQAAPTGRLTSVASAYWTRMGSKEHLRWVMPEPEGELLDALARLHAAGTDTLIPEGRLVGMFRAHGLLTPVWDLPVGTGAEALEDPAADFKTALDAALADHRARGTRITAEAQQVRPGVRIAFLEGPDGVVLELLERRAA